MDIKSNEYNDKGRKDKIESDAKPRNDHVNQTGDPNDPVNAQHDLLHYRLWFYQKPDPLNVENKLG